jgi:hypothetical protein
VRVRLKELVSAIERIAPSNAMKAAKQNGKEAGSTLQQWLADALTDAKKAISWLDKYLEAYERETG